jgi:hypothetical protein
MLGYALQSASQTAANDFEPAQVLRNWHAQRPSKQDSLHLSVMEEFGGVYYIGIDLLFN